MGAYLREAVKRPFDVSQKTGHQDIVTVFDREVEQFFRTKIHAQFPGDCVVGEEYPGAAEESQGVRWYIDPIDGTTNFVNLRKNFAISVGCYLDGSPQFSFVLDVVNHDLYTAFAGEGAYKNGWRLDNKGTAAVLEQMILSTPNVQDTFWRNYPWQKSMLTLADQVRAVRSLGSVALELCAVAEGIIDVFVAMRSSPWDHNGARLILEEAGCCISELGKDSLCTDREAAIIACKNAGVYNMLKDEYQC